MARARRVIIEVVQACADAAGLSESTYAEMTAAFAKGKVYELAMTYAQRGGEARDARERVLSLIAQPSDEQEPTT